jgi:hypothetical protein
MRDDTTEMPDVSVHRKHCLPLDRQASYCRRSRDHRAKIPEDEAGMVEWIQEAWCPFREYMIP